MQNFGRQMLLIQGRKKMQNTTCNLTQQPVSYYEGHFAHIKHFLVSFSSLNGQTFNFPEFVTSTTPFVTSKGLRHQTPTFLQVKYLINQA